MKRRELSTLIIAFICFATFTSNKLKAQNIEVRTFFGLTYYMGDLAPHSIDYSVSKGHVAGGFYIGGKVTDFASLGVTFMRGNLSGDDSEALDAQRIKRNLHFVSHLYEMGIRTEIYFNKILPFMSESPINYYATVGLNIFHFDPRAYYEGDWIPLQPLSTEGQGLESYPETKNYDLFQFNVPVGLGLNFNLTGNFNFGIEITPRITFTDYLDDVSNQYINEEALVNERGELAANLHFRSDELPFAQTEELQVQEGKLRGNPNNNDWYLYTSIYFSYNLQGSKSKKRRRK